MDQTERRFSKLQGNNDLLLLSRPAETESGHIIIGVCTSGYDEEKSETVTRAATLVGLLQTLPV